MGCRKLDWSYNISVQSLIGAYLAMCHVYSTTFQPIKKLILNNIFSFHRLVRLGRQIFVTSLSRSDDMFLKVPVLLWCEYNITLDIFFSS